MNEELSIIDIMSCINCKNCSYKNDNLFCNQKNTKVNDNSYCASFIEDKEKVTFKNIKEQKRKEEFESFCKECITSIALHQEDLATELIVKYIEMNYKIYTTRDDIKSEIWVYNDGIFIPNGRTKIEEITRKILGQIYTPQRVNKIIAKIEADTYIDIDKFFGYSNIEEIPVQNGILNLLTLQLQPFTPNKIFFNKLPIKYDSEAKCPNIDKFLNDILKTEEDKNVMYEKFGYDLWKDHFIEKATMLVGEGRNGKSKLLALKKAFLGAENCCSVSLGQMHSGSTSICEMHNKLVNLAGDLSNTSLKETGLFKEVVGRDTIGAKRKYLRDLFFTNHAKQYFACNELPRVYDKSMGFWSKWDLFEFPYTFIPECDYNSLDCDSKEKFKIMDVDIINKITTPEELSGLLNKAIEGLHKILKKKDFSYVKKASNIKEWWIKKSDSFIAFCMEYIEQSDKFLTKKELRNAYYDYCKKNKVRGASDNYIKMILGNEFGVVENRREIKNYNSDNLVSSEWVHVWDGISFKKSL